MDDGPNRTHHRLFTGTFPDGSQLLITQWFDDEGTLFRTEACTRPRADTTVTWGPPITLTEQ